jgi:hypothetical protein
LRPTKEVSSGMFNNRHLQVKSMLALAVPRKWSDEPDGILQSVVSGAESLAVETIVIHQIVPFVK